METQTASSSSSSRPYWKFDVFLSFRGEDTRLGFTGHLYQTLIQKGIITFRDDERLERGKSISADLLKAIEESQFAIVILSTNYASSKWCLAELAKIVECMKQNMLTILPVFYHVNPSDARNQMGILASGNQTFAEAFAKHERDPKVKIEDLQAWKAALKEVGNISGWHVNDRYDLFLQSIFVQIISINFVILYSLKLFTSPRLTFNMKNFSFFFLSNRIKETFSFSSKNLCLV